eukprot:SAG11_NODE_1943_length_4020_cov_8.087733_4_plen_538_part_00
MPTETHHDRLEHIAQSPKNVQMTMATVAALFIFVCAGTTQADSSQLRVLDVPGEPKQVISSILLKIQELEDRTQSMEAELQNKTLVEANLREEIRSLQIDRDVFQNKTQVFAKENTALWVEVAYIRSALYQLSNKTETKLRRISMRLDQCEADSFMRIMKRRQTQEQTPICGQEAVDNMLAACCASGAPADNGHRLQESVGCDSLPPTCSLQCSHQFISIFDNCYDDALMRDLSVEQLSEWNSFYAECSDVTQSAAEMSMGALQPVNVRMFRITIPSDAAQSQAEMLSNGGQTQPPSDSDSTDLEQYQTACASKDIVKCAPPCNSTHHGFELLATIDGADTKFSCNLANNLYSWTGVASAPGGYIGSNLDAFRSSLNSGAAGVYAVSNLPTGILNVNSDVTIVYKQRVQINGAVVYDIVGDGPQFSVRSGPCVVDVTGRCVGRPSGYSDNEECAILPTRSFELFSCPVFSTEAGYDHVTIDGIHYNGAHCPSGTRVTLSSQIDWHSDANTVGEGWQICAPHSGARSCLPLRFRRIVG